MKKKLVMLLMATTLVFGATACGNADKEEAEATSTADEKDADKAEDEADEAEDEAEEADDEEEAEEAAEDVEYDAEMIKDYFPEDNFMVNVAQEGFEALVAKSGDKMMMGYEVGENSIYLTVIDDIVYAEVSFEGEQANQYATVDPSEMGITDAATGVFDFSEIDSCELVESGKDTDIINIVADGEELELTIDKKEKKIVLIKGESVGAPVEMSIEYDIDLVAPFDISEAEEIDSETLGTEFAAILMSAMSSMEEQ